VKGDTSPMRMTPPGPEAIINRTMATEEFPEKKRRAKRSSVNTIRIIPSNHWRHRRPQGWTLGYEHRTPAVYSPFNQASTGDFYVTLRTSESERAALPSMVNAVHQLDPGLIVNGDETMTDRITIPSCILHRSRHG